MKKIVIISPILQHYRLTFYEKLSRINDNYHFHVFYGVKKKEDGRPSFSGDVRFDAKGFEVSRFSIASLAIRYNRGMLAELKQVNPDIIIIQGITGNLSYRRIMSWARRRNKKIIIWTCGWESKEVKGTKKAFKDKFVASFFRKADYFLTYSNSASDYVRNMGINQSMIETCYNGVEIDHLIQDHDTIISNSKKIVEKYDLKSSTTFLFVGALANDKKPLMLMDAFLRLREKYKGIKLIIIGDGPLKSAVEERIELAQDQNIFYLGRIIDGIDQYFAAGDCLVLPGAGGLALNQAMFWGKVCIVSKADGTEDDLVLDGVTGYRFKESDLDSLISAMERRINVSQEELDMMSQKSRKMIREVSNVNNMVRIFVSAIDKYSN